MRTAAMICLSLALAGCALSSAERQERQRQQMAANAEASCRVIGLDKTNEKWTDCMIEMMAADKRSEATRPSSAQASDNDQDLSFMCKDAIARGDRGGTFIFC